MLLSVLRLSLSEAALSASIPIVDYMAASLAWELFKDHERSGGLLKPFMAKQLPDGSGKLPAGACAGAYAGASAGYPPAGAGAGAATARSGASGGARVRVRGVLMAGSSFVM